MRKALLLTVFGFCITILPACAQGSGEVYAAPGMRVHLQRGLPAVPTTLRPALAKLGPAAQPPSPILARFWHQSDTAKLIAAQPFYRFTSSKLRYPANSLRAEIEGNFAARLTVLADGSVGKVEITRRDTVGDAATLYAARGLADLDAEIIRVMKLVRFESNAAPADTITVTSVFRMQ